MTEKSSTCEENTTQIANHDGKGASGLSSGDKCPMKILHSDDKSEADPSRPPSLQTFTHEVHLQHESFPRCKPVMLCEDDRKYVLV